MELVDRIEFAYPVSTMFEADSTWLFGREPTPRRMPDGSIVSLLYTGGKQEPAPENVATVIRSEDDGETWSKPQLLFRHPFRCTWGTELFTEGERPFAVFQTFCYETVYAELRAFLTFTDDSGRSWSNPVSLPGVPANFSVRQGKVLSDGSWIFPVYWFCNRTKWDTIRAPGNGFVSGVLRSTDGGKSFSLHGAVETPESAWEPEVTELEPGHLKMYVRYEHPAAVLWESESFDYGKSWTPARPSEIPNPGTKFVIYRIRGRHVLVNNVCTPDHPYRDVLELWVSSDNCATWEKNHHPGRLSARIRRRKGGKALSRDRHGPEILLPQGAVRRLPLSGGTASRGEAQASSAPSPARRSTAPAGSPASTR